MDALEIINDWIGYARNKKLSPHSKYFWNARDIIEGNCKHLSTSIKIETYVFINTFDDSEKKQIVLKALEGKNENIRGL